MKDQKGIESMNWYVLRVMGGKEKKTVSFIEKEIIILSFYYFWHQAVNKVNFILGAKNH